MIIPVLVLACALSWFVFALVGFETTVLALMFAGLGITLGIEIGQRLANPPFPPRSEAHTGLLASAATHLPDGDVALLDGPWFPPSTRGGTALERHG